MTEKHTIEAIKKNKMIQIGASETLGDQSVFNRLVDRPVSW